MAFLVLFLLFLGFNAVAWWWGFDSRDGQDWTAGGSPTSSGRRRG
jgi:hypothetical protein